MQKLLTPEAVKAASEGREYLIPSEVAGLLGVDAYSINIQVREDKKAGKNSFPFPTILIGNRVKIPKRAFLEAMHFD